MDDIIVMEPAIGQSSKAKRLPRPVHGLDAGQILLTGFFGLSSTRAAKKVQTLQSLGAQARGGDLEAAEKLLAAMSRGEEPSTA